MIDVELGQILSDGSFYLVVGLLAATLFYAMVGFRETRNGQFHGLLFLLLSSFFMTLIGYYVGCLPDDEPLGQLLSSLDMWGWLVVMAAPVLIGLFILFGLIRFCFSDFRNGLIRLFFGVTLVFFLYMAGNNWPLDLKGIIVMLWSLSWFEIEFITAH